MDDPLTKETRQGQKKLDGDVMSVNCDVIVFFSICSHLEAGSRTHGLENLHFH